MQYMQRSSNEVLIQRAKNNAWDNVDAVLHGATPWHSGCRTPRATRAHILNCAMESTQLALRLSRN